MTGIPKAPGAKPYRNLLRRYRKASLGGEQELVVRCAVDAVMHFKDTQQLVSIKALNEFDPKCAHFLLLCRLYQ